MLLNILLCDCLMGNASWQITSMCRTSSYAKSGYRIIDKNKDKIKANANANQKLTTAAVPQACPQEETRQLVLTQVEKGNYNLKTTAENEIISHKLAKAAVPETLPKVGTQPKVEEVELRSVIKQLKDKLFSQVTYHRPKVTDKITIVGAGANGMSCVSALLGRNLTKTICIMDIRKNLVKAEASDFLYASVFNNNPRIITCTDGSRTADSKYVIITCGARPSLNDSQLKIAQRNTDLLSTIMSTLVKHSPMATYIVVTHPSDLMTYAVQKITNLPNERCISMGTHLDTARFRYLIAKRLGMSPGAVQGYIIGECGLHSVPVWSSVTVGGVPLSTINPLIGTENDTQKWSEVHMAVVNCANDLIKVKGTPNWGVGLSVANLIDSMRQNCGRVISIGTNCKGINGIRSGVVMSMPCIVNADGISHITNLRLTPWEKKKLHNAEKLVLVKQYRINIDKK